MNTAPTDLKIVPLARHPKDVHRFLMVSYEVYRHDPHWVAPLLMDVKKVFTDANPFFQHAEMALWVASRGGKDVGRVAGIIDHSHNQFQNDSAAFFGFFESLDEPAVSHALFETVFGWARQKGLRRVLGPMNPSTNDECGLLVEGFDSSPVLMMTYNPRYYLDLFAAEGLRKAKDLIAFHIDLVKSPLDRLSRIAEKTRQRNPELTFRPVLRKTLNADLTRIKEVYNRAWERNWGFVPMTDVEIDFMAARLKPLLVEGLIWLVEREAEPVAFMLAIPDFNQPLKPLRGRLLTPAFLGFLPYALGWRSPTKARVITLGVVEGYRGRGLEAVMLSEGLRVGARLGLRDAEASWVLEENVKMRRIIELFGGRTYKIYRIYERDV